MTRVQRIERPRSLAHQIVDLEKQLSHRRLTVRTLVTHIQRKVTAPVITPGALVVAVGIGVALEQTSHHKGWSLATVLDAADASIRLLLSFKASETASR